MSDHPDMPFQPARSSEHHEYAHLLRKVDLFAGLDRVTLAKLAAHLQPLSYAARSVIFRQGEPGDAFYLVASGSVGVYAIDRSGAVEKQVKILQVGEPFGEMALLSNIPRTATIKVEADCQVLRLDRSAFVKLVKEEPSVGLAIAATLSQPLAGMLDRLRDKDVEAGAPAVFPDTAQIGAAIGGRAEVAAAATAERPRWRPGRTGIAIAAGIAILTVGWISPSPPGLTLVAWHGLVALLAILPALVLDALLEGALA